MAARFLFNLGMVEAAAELILSLPISLKRNDMSKRNAWDSVESGNAT